MTRLAALIVAVASLVGPAVALAQTAAPGPSDSIFSLKVACYNEINDRLTTIKNLQSTVSAASDLAAAHRAALDEMLTSSASGLQSLQQQIVDSGDLASVQADCARIVSDYRINSLVVPVVNVVIANDLLRATCCEHLEGELLVAKAKFSELQAQHPDCTTDCQAIQAGIDDISAKLADLTAFDGGLADAVLAYKPADYPAVRSALAADIKQLDDLTKELKDVSSEAQSLLLILLNLCNREGC